MLTALGTVLFCGIGAGAALALGQDTSWDLRNHHAYIAHAFLNDRIGLDWAPAQRQSYHCPYLDLPFALLNAALPPRATGAILGAIHGLNGLLVACLAWRILSTVAWRSRLGLALVCGLLGLGDATVLAELGSTMGDNLVSLFLLASLLLAVGRLSPEAPKPRPAWGRGLLASGLLLGLGVGLKPTLAPYAVGYGLALLLCLPGGLVPRFLGLLTWTAVAWVGIAATFGSWAWRMEQAFGNPLFPYFNHRFQSPWAMGEPYADDRYLPDGPMDALWRPMEYLLGHSSVAEPAFRDPRPAVVLLLVIVAAAGWRRSRVGPAAERSQAKFLLVFAGLSWVFWLLLFATHRFLSPLGLLTPLIVVVVGRNLLPAGGMRVAAIASLLAAVTLPVQPPDWGRRDWDESWFGVELPVLPDPEGTVVVVTGDEADSYLITAAPPGVRFVRIRSNFTFTEQPTQLQREMRQAVAEARDLRYLLGAGGVDATALSDYALELDESSCSPIQSHLDAGLMLCRLRR